MRYQGKHVSLRRMVAILPKAKISQRKITWKEILRQKALDRKRDGDRLASGKISVEDFQRDYSAVSVEFIRNCKCPNLYKHTKAYRRRK